MAEDGHTIIVLPKTKTIEAYSGVCFYAITTNMCFCCDHHQCECFEPKLTGMVGFAKNSI